MSALVQQVTRAVDALVKNHDVRDLIRREQTWLEQAERTVKEVQRWRDLEGYRFWPGCISKTRLFAMSRVLILSTVPNTVILAEAIHVVDPIDFGRRFRWSGPWRLLRLCEQDGA